MMLFVERSCPHTEQYMSPAFPSSSHVAGITFFTAALCPATGIMVSSYAISFVQASSLKYLPHAVQYQYSMFPFTVQVGSFAATAVTALWLFGFISPYSAPQTEHIAFDAHAASSHQTHAKKRTCPLNQTKHALKICAKFDLTRKREAAKACLLS